MFLGSIFETLINTSIRNTEDLLMNFYLFRDASMSVYEDFCPYHYMVREGSAATAKINEHKLGDPLYVLRIIRNEVAKDAALQKCINTRIAGRLIQLVTMDLGSQADLIRPFKTDARKELRKMIPTLLKGDYSKRIQVLSIWAAFSPVTYSAVHKVYSSIRGTDRKYEFK